MTLSIHQHIRLRAKSFEFRLPFPIEKAALKFAPEISSIPGRPGVMDFIGRFEALGSDFADVCRILGRPELTLCQLRAGTEHNYREAFTCEMVGIVGDIYRRDIEALGYEFH